MRINTIVLDFAVIDGAEDFISTMIKIFQMPDWCGRNLNALVDCLSSLRFPNDEMIGIALEDDEYISLEVRGIKGVSKELVDGLLAVVEGANFRSEEKGRGPVIFMLIRRQR
jgi:hypothetical protein